MPTTRTASDLTVTTTDHPSAQLMRQGFAAFDRGDLEAVRATFTDDAVWTNGGSSAIAGTYRGWEEIQRMFLRLFEQTGGTVKMDLVSVLGDDTHAVAVYDSTSTVKGRTQTHRFVLVEEIATDGRARSSRVMAYDQASADAHLAG